MYVAVTVRPVRGGIAAPSLSGLGRRRRRFVGRGLGYQVGDRLTEAEMQACRYVAEPGWAYFHDNAAAPCSVSYKQYSGGHLPFDSLIIAAPPDQSVAPPAPARNCIAIPLRCSDGRIYEDCKARSTANYPCGATQPASASSSSSHQAIQPCRVLANGMRVCVAPIFRPDGSVILPPIGGPADDNPLLPAIYSAPASSSGSSMFSAVSDAVGGVTTEVTSWWNSLRAQVSQVPTWGWIVAGAGVAYLYTRRRRRGF